jgi:GTP-binding protein
MAAQTNFIDIATIWLHAGKGGDGAVSFHREKFVAAGGPDGGDGGRGGDIIFVVDDHLTTLMDFRYKRKYVAPEGGKGGASLCHGKNAENLVIKVPLGTVIKDAESGLVIADLSDHTPVTIAKGGRGGYGNAHFATPTRQIPKFAKPGMPGEDIQVTLELKLIADVGLIGFPNVGKSTLISTISAAKPKIANYHFTTLVPTLGVVSVAEGASFVCADIPGLIEGASEGIGLGHDFLRHVERCRLLLHVVDVSGSECREPVEDFEKINEELAKFSPELAQRPQIVVGNKCDLATEEQIETFRRYLEANPEKYIAQPTLALSNCPTFVESGVAPRHLDLRPFVLSGREVQLVPGGLTRVALREGSLVVNSSQGGGTKDTWVLEA